MIGVGPRHGLAEVETPHVATVVQKVILAEIAVHEVAEMEQCVGQREGLHVQLVPVHWRRRWGRGRRRRRSVRSTGP